MKKALFAALASVAMLGASCSCSVKDFVPVVLDKSSIAVSFPVSFSAVSNADGYLSTSDTLGKFSFRYGLLSPNLVQSTNLYVESPVIKAFRMHLVQGVTYTVSLPSAVSQLNIDYWENGRQLPEMHTSNNSGFTFTCAHRTGEYLLFINDGTALQWGAAPYYVDVLMVNEGSTALPYQPFGYGVSVDTPFLKASRSFALPLDASLKPDGQFTYNGLLGDGASWMFKYGYDYVDAAHPRTTQTCIGMTFVSEEQRTVFLDRFTDLALPRREYSNCSYVDYELGAVDATDGHCGIYLYFRPVFPSNNLVESYMSFNTGSYDDGYTDGYDYGYYVGYRESTYEIVKGIEEVSLSYLTGSGHDEENHSVSREGVEAFDLLRSHCINGLLQLDAIYDDLIPSSDSDAHRLLLVLSYSDAKTVDAAPLYIDYKQLADPIPFAQQTQLSVYTPVNLPIQRWNAFSGYLDVGYQGQLGSYPGLSYDERFRSYTRISVTYPVRNVGGELRYLGVLSEYARGYADGVASRDGEVNDLTERILGLEEDLSQYQGKNYQQIYNSGYQAGLDEENQGARTFNSLFGNILTAPLTILNGVSDISFFGMPILTAILSLLMVALALYLFKRFK